MNDTFRAAWGSALTLQDSPQAALKNAVNLINPILAKG
jgi:hypothetical protein